MASLLDISVQAFADETNAVTPMLDALSFLAPLEAGIRSRAEGWVKELRGQEHSFGTEAFLQEYGLDTGEGVAIMCLAEALLRIPDAATADALIADKFEHAKWEKHLGRSDSFLVNASSWGLLLTGKIVQMGGMESGPAALLGRLAARMGEPIVREALKAAMRYIGTQFVLAETVEGALENAKKWRDKGYRFSFDLLGEGARSDAQAQAYVKAYHEAIRLIGAAGMDAPSISVKLSALHARYQLTQKKRVFAELLPRLKTICLLAKQHHIAVSIDAEEASRLDIELMLFSELFADKDLTGWNGLGFVVQAYQKRAVAVIEYLTPLAQQCGKTMPIRLVKGAYWDYEIKAAQVAGLPGYPVFTRKEHTDMSYLACANAILKAGDCFYPQFATHNARTIATIQAMATHYQRGNGSFEFQRLHGMGEALHDMLLPDYKSRIYAPIGAHKDLLAYLIRRLLENGANTSFVNLLMDEDTPLSILLADPLSKVQLQKAVPNPTIPLPLNMFADRRNSPGVDLGNLAQLEALEVALANAALPAPDIQAREVKEAVSAAQKAAADWAQTQAEERCRLIEAFAGLLEQRQAESVAIVTHEVGKTIPDAITEWREAIDFCRYYSNEARRLFGARTLPGPTGEHNALSLHPRGVFACISPWNFPLSIFIGQVVAALATGNTVIAKPAEQSPQVAAFATRLLHEAGIPKGALQLLPGDGKVGAALVQSAIDGVVFTGSVEAARHINRALAAKDGAIIPFIAETGGLNAMIVDSSALIEQAVDNIIVSAFGNAGQRCSSLRVLYVQDDIADALIELLSGAMQELTLGEARDLSTDIGPVIDAEAQAKLLAHIEVMKKKATLLAATPLSRAQGHFVAPHAFEIGSIKDLPGEVFGPILHVVRFKAGDLARVCDEINACGYGLTFGIETRIEEHAGFCTGRVRAGNCYINRSMVGAVVGVQPFGGEGLSGTGPKAGGPHYLMRFVTERTVSTNTAAIGGNLALLSGN